MRQFALAALISVLAIPAQGATLTTTFESTTGSAGNMFDILVGSQDIRITGLDVNIRGGTTVNLEWYFLPGTHVGSATTPGAWTLLDQGFNITSSGTNTATHWDVSDTVFSAGQSYGFYITTTVEGASNPMRYSVGTGVGNEVTSDTALTIYEGLGGMYAFGQHWAPRIWNGAIHYEIVGVSAVPLPAAGWLLLAALGALGFAGYRRNRSPQALA